MKSKGKIMTEQKKEEILNQLEVFYETACELKSKMEFISYLVNNK